MAFDKVIKGTFTFCNHAIDQRTNRGLARKRHRKAKSGSLMFSLRSILGFGLLISIITTLQLMHRAVIRNGNSHTDADAFLPLEFDKDESMSGLGSGELELAFATFRAVTEKLPSITLDGTDFPRGPTRRAFMGTGLWNSRLSLPRALRAMLGDASAYMETPAFTACRLQLQYGSNQGALHAAMRRELFQTSDKRLDWMGYYRFIEEIGTKINCTRSSSVGEGEMDEAKAARGAQFYIDSKFRNMNLSQMEALATALATDKANEFSDLLYTTVYPNVASQYYGPSVAVFEPDFNRRGLDVGYFFAATTINTSNGRLNSCDDIPRRQLEPDVPDAGEMITPGYKMPSSVAGFEIRRKSSLSDERHVHLNPQRKEGYDVPSITHAFYKESLPDHGTAVFLLHFTPGRVHCVQKPSNTHYGSYFECNGGANPSGSHCVIESDDEGDISRPLRTTGFIFDEEFRGGCDAAKQLLMKLPAEHRDLGNNTQYLFSQTFQNVVSTVSQKLGKDLFVAHFTRSKDTVACSRVVLGETLWQAHREVASLHVGYDTHQATCMARVPQSWKNEDVIWDASVASRSQTNPLERDVFVGKTGEGTTFTSGEPDWASFMGVQKDLLENRSCYGFRDSTCTVKLTNGPTTGKVEMECELDCTFSGAWHASLDAPAKCHTFAGDLLTLIVPTSDWMGMKFMHMLPQMNHVGMQKESNLVSQSVLDPLHWPQTKHQGSMNIVMTSDIHGFILGYCSEFCSSGALSLSSLLETVRISSGISRTPTLALDAGDALFGSGLPPHEVASVMNALDIDAMALGNHDLDFGIDELKDIAQNASFAILAANVEGMHFLSNTLVKDTNIGGLPYRICITGLSTPEPNPLAGENLTFSDNIVALQKGLYTNQGRLKCDMRILLSHLGYKEDTSIARQLQEFEGPNLILGGHSHVIFGTNTNAQSNIGKFGTFLNKPFPYYVDGVPIAHVGANGMYAGIFTVTPHKSLQGVDIQGSLQPLGIEHGVFPSLEMELPRSQFPSSGNIKPIVAETYPDEFVVCNANCRREECLAGNFVADAMRNCILDDTCGGTANKNSKHHVIAMLESGTLRGCAYDDLSQMLPWPNKLVIFTMKGRIIRNMLQHGIHDKLDRQGGGFLQVSGVQYNYRERNLLEVWQTNPPTKHRRRVSTDLLSAPSVTFDSTECEEKKLCNSRTAKILDDVGYHVVVTDWLAQGGDGFGPIIKGINVTYTNTTLQSAVLHYSIQHPIIQKEMRSWDADRQWYSLSVAAFIGTLLATFISYPLYSVTVLQATSRNSIRQKGLLRLYDGVFLTAVAGAVSNGLFFLFYETLFVKHPMARAVTGAVMNVFLTNPLWVVITRIQTLKHISINQCYAVAYTTRSIIHEEGYGGFFDGVFMNLIMCIFPCVRQICFEMFQSLALLHWSPSHSVAGLCGVLASCIANLVTYPIQRFRIRQQAALNCDLFSISHLCDGVTFKLIHSVVSGFILYAAISVSVEVSDIIQG
mmetsp:Transcript_25954/g.55809  ORF Transcript_25954/g.55809 Transcript_25954/m.55809 type:complete len:1494 (+) Transcript_25954:41-4522(+)